jgi:hypothetical protein
MSCDAFSFCTNTSQFPVDSAADAKCRPFWQPSDGLEDLPGVPLAK